MKLNVAIIHKEQQVKTRNYRIWVTKHNVETEDGAFTIEKFKSSYVSPRPEDDVLLLDNKWVVYVDNQVAPLDREWQPAKITPTDLRGFMDRQFLNSFMLYTHPDSLWSYLSNMFKSWCSKLTLKKKPTHVVGVQKEDIVHDELSEVQRNQLADKKEEA